jgi:hypothetical protein
MLSDAGVRAAVERCGAGGGLCGHGVGQKPCDALRAEQVAAIFLSQTGRFPAARKRWRWTCRSACHARRVLQQDRGAYAGADESLLDQDGVYRPRPAAARTAQQRRRAQMVADNPAMIAYIDRAALDASVKAIQVMP